MSFRREREHISWPLGAVILAMGVLVCAWVYWLNVSVYMYRRTAHHSGRRWPARLSPRKPYQKAGQIDFTTLCLTPVFGESWTPGKRRSAFWWGNPALSHRRDAL